MTDDASPPSPSPSKLARPSSHLSVRVAPTTYADLQGAAICNLLAFSGAFPPQDPLSLTMNPFRAPLVRAGAHPRHWPDFNSTVRELEYHLLSGQMLFTAFVSNDPDNVNANPSVKAVGKTGPGGGKEIIAGLVRMTPPLDVLQRRMKERKWKDRVLRDVVYPVVDNVKHRLWDESDGTNRECADLLSRELATGRRRVDPEQKYYLINMTFTHPSYQDRGVGAALLSTCTSISDADGVPIYLESSAAGLSLYASCGFVPIDVVDFVYAGRMFTLPIMSRQPVAPPFPAKGVPSATADEETTRGRLEEVGQNLEVANTKALASGSNLDDET